jgi:DNA-binding NarL/FixJ family response regulator
MRCRGKGQPVSSRMGRRSPTRYVLVPGPGGSQHIAPIDALAVFRITAPDSRIVVCSGFLTEELRVSAGQFGAVAVLEKPVGLDTLVNTVAAAA